MGLDMYLSRKNCQIVMKMMNLNIMLLGNYVNSKKK